MALDGVNQRSFSFRYSILPIVYAGKTFHPHSGIGFDVTRIDWLYLTASKSLYLTPVKRLGMRPLSVYELDMYFFVWKIAFRPVCRRGVVCISVEVGWDMFFWSIITCILRIRRVELNLMRSKCSIWPIFGILKAQRGDPYKLKFYLSLSSLLSPYFWTLK